MTNDQFGGSLDRILQDYERRLQKLEAGQRSAPGLTIGQTSGALLIPSTGLPGVPSSGVYLYASGSEFRWRDSTGSDHSASQQGDAVANPPNFQSGTASGSDATMINQLRADAAGTKIALDNLLSSLRDSDQLL